MKKFNKLIPLLFYTVLFSTEILACTLSTDSTVNIIEENYYLVQKFALISLLLSTFTIFLFFKKGRKGWTSIIISLLIVGITLSSSTFAGDCGYGAVELAQYSILITFLCFTFQFFTWLLKRK